METSISDAALFDGKLVKALISLFATYVGDTLHAGTVDYYRLFRKTSKS